MSEKPSLERLARGHHVALEYHRMLLDDPHRMDAYERAIRRLVRPGDVVLDLGCGTGILAMLAARRGAARVHAVESTPVAALAAELVRVNGLAERVKIHQQDFRSMPPEEPVDLIVSDFMGRFLVDDGMLPVVATARQWLKPAGRFCPSRVRLILAPVGDIFLHAVDLFATPLFTLDFRAALPYAFNYCYHAELCPEALMAAPQTYGTYVPPADAQPFDNQLTFSCDRNGRLQGVAGWFEATLSPDIVLTTKPGVQTHWGQYLFPLPPQNVLPGDRLRFHLRQEVDSGLNDTIWRWAGDVTRRGQRLSSFQLESLQRLGERRWEEDAKETAE